MTTDLETISLRSHAVRERPYDLYELIQSDSGVHHDAQLDIYLIASHDLIKQAARDVETFSSEIDMRREVGGPDSTASDELFLSKGYVVPDVLSQVDPPRHTAFRRLVEQLFIPPIVNRMDAYIEARVNELIDGFVEKGEVEFYEEFAVILPIDVIADQLGVPRSEGHRLREWTDAIIQTLGIMLSAKEKLAATEKIIEFQHYFVERLKEKAASPDTTIISLIEAARLESEDRSLTTEEKLALIQQLVVAGNETTRNHLAKCIYLLTLYPEIQADLHRNPDDVPRFVEEALRYESPVQGLFRRVTRNTTLGGYPLPKNAKVMLLYGAGNRDSSLFEKPERFLPQRSNAKQHLAFGYGPHFCIGSNLARKELIVSIRQLLSRLADVRLREENVEVRHLPNLILRGIEPPLHLCFEKRA